MWLIDPSETVDVEVAHLGAAVASINAALQTGEKIHPTARTAARDFGWAPIAAAGTTTPYRVVVHAERVWWVVQAADEIGHALDLAPTGDLFDAVDSLGIAVAEQAPRTDYGLVALMEAETVLAFAAAREDHTHE